MLKMTSSWNVINIEIFINKHSDCNIIIGGDLNLDFSRKNAHDLYFMDLLYRHNLRPGWQSSVAKSDYTFTNGNAYTQIDHFCLDHYLLCKVIDMYPHDCALNPSGHRPIVFALEANQQSVNVKAVDDTSPSRTILWHKVNDLHIMEYRNRIDTALSSLSPQTVQNCENLNCSDPNHCRQIDSWCVKLINLCIQAGQCFPNSWNYKRTKQFPGWNEEVRPLREECIFWHNLWKENGRPNTGIIFENKMASKKDYMYAVRRCKRREKYKRYEKMAGCIADNNSRDFFKEVRKVNASKQKSPTCINGKYESNDIAELFAAKYESLFNCVPSNKSSWNLLKML